MKQFNNVRGTMENVPTVHVDKDTVYVRTNVKKIESEDFTGWEYDEVQYNKDEYIEKLTNEEDVGVMALMISMLMSEVDMLKSVVMGGSE